MQKYIKEFKKGFILYPILISILIILSVIFIVQPYLSYINLIFLDNPLQFSEKEYDKFDIDKFNVLNTGNVRLDSDSFPTYGELIGNISIDNAGVNSNVYFGDSNEVLSNGVGISIGSFIPGYGKTILMLGHNNTFFNGLKNISINDEVKIKTFYGYYVYKVIDIKILDEKDSSAYDLSANKENLIMYTCYPFDILGITSKRIFIYGELVSGPAILH